MLFKEIHMKQMPLNIRPANKRIAAVLVAAVMTVSAAGLSGCAQNETTASAANISYYTNSKAIDIDDMFTDRDLSGSYDETNVSWIKLGKEKVVKITQEGTYIVSGTLKDGQILVDAPEDAKVQIVLDGAKITNDDSAAILVKSANKVFVTTAEGSENTLTVSGKFDSSTADTATDDATETTSDSAASDTDLSGVDAVIYSKADLTVNGEGNLTIKSAYGHGIVSKDDLALASLNLTIKAKKKAVDANDSVRIASGTYKLTAGTDGIHAEDEDKGTGFVYIADGQIRIKAGDDGIHANTDLILDGGTLNIKKCAEGLEGNTVTINDGSVQLTASDDGINAVSQKKNTETETTGTTETDGTSGATQADRGKGHGPGAGGGLDVYDESCLIVINGGEVHVDAEGDGIDSNGSITISGGTTSVEGPENNGNGILDVGGREGTAVITGGTFIATGTSGMAVQFSDESTQGCILTTADAKAGTTKTQTSSVTLADADGNIIASQTTDKQFNCVQISSPEISSGNTYTLDVDGTKTEIAMDGLLYGEGTGMQGGKMPGGEMQNGTPQAPGQDGISEDRNTEDENSNGGNSNGGKMKQHPDGERTDGPPNGKPSGHPDGKPSRQPDGNSSGNPSDPESSDDAAETQEL